MCFHNPYFTPKSSHMRELIYSFHMGGLQKTLLNLRGSLEQKQHCKADIRCQSGRVVPDRVAATYNERGNVRNMDPCDMCLWG